MADHGRGVLRTVSTLGKGTLALSPPLSVPSASPKRIVSYSPLGSVSLCFATSLTVVCQATVRDPNDLYSESLSPFGASMYNLAHTYEAQGQGDSGLNVHPVEVPLAPAPIYTTA